MQRTNKIRAVLTKPTKTVKTDYVIPINAQVEIIRIWSIDYVVSVKCEYYDGNTTHTTDWMPISDLIIK